MKTVFSNSQVCHVWAQQKQENGRNSSSTLYFEGTEIYSYGSHFLAAKFISKNVVLVNSRTYSPTTGQHLSDIRSALSDDIQYFRVPNPSELKCTENFNYYNDSVLDYYYRELKSIKVTSQSSIDYTVERLIGLCLEANEFFQLAGFSLIEIDVESISLLRSHLEFRLKRYQELNSPENIAKKEAKKARIAALEQAKQVEILQENIKQFKICGDYRGLRSLKYALLFVNARPASEGASVVHINANIKTSKGSNVPLKAGILLLKAIENNTAVIGASIGHFTLTRITEIENDKIITINCHDILLSEAKEVLKPYMQNHLKIVS